MSHLLSETMQKAIYSVRRIQSFLSMVIQNQMYLAFGRMLETIHPCPVKRLEVVPRIAAAHLCSHSHESRVTASRYPAAVHAHRVCSVTAALTSAIELLSLSFCLTLCDGATCHTQTQALLSTASNQRSADDRC